MMSKRWGLRTVMATIGVVTSLAAGLPVYAKSVRSDLDLTSTAAAPGAGGMARIVVRNSSIGRFNVSMRRLKRQSTYDLLVGGIKVATLHTNRNGSAHLRFTNLGRRGDLILGFDPRGNALEVRNAAGDDVLLGTLPETTTPDDAGKVTCCIADDHGPECEDRTPDECAAQGGAVVSAGSCLPNPCGATPPEGTEVVCCMPDSAGPQCEDRTQADCAMSGGTVVEATSCSPNPCISTSPPPDTHVQCCVAAYYIWACEDHTVEECHALGGLDKGPGTCSPNPCGEVPPSTGHGICCLPNATWDPLESTCRHASLSIL